MREIACERNGRITIDLLDFRTFPSPLIATAANRFANRGEGFNE